VRSPVAAAPAMNEKMYLHPSVQKNMEILKSRGVRFIEPDHGYLACGESGWGRLASPEKIVGTCLALLEQSRSLKGKKVVVTAGPTREYLDPVRFISNRSSGKMGLAMAEEALSRGAEVCLIAGPSVLRPSAEIEYVPVEAGGEMAGAIKDRLNKADILVMAAAVCDFAFSKKNVEKKKKTAGKPPELKPADDILRDIGREKEDIFLVGFAAETENMKDNAQDKLRRKNLDMIVANDVSRKDAGFDSDWNQVFIYRSDGRSVETPRESKLQISRRIWNEIEDLYG